MAKMTLEEGKDFATFPADTLLTVKIEEIGLREMTGNTGNKWEKLNFKFKILAVDVVEDGSEPEQFDDMLGEFIYGGVSARFTTATENKLRQWVSAILNMELDLGFELDTDLLVGRTVRALTSQYTKKGATLPGHQVESLVPIQGGYTPPSRPDLEPPF